MNPSFEKVDELTEVLEQVIVEGKIQKKISEACKAYMCEYFFQSSVGNYYLWDAEDKIFFLLTEDQLKKIYMNKMPKQVSDWFFKENRKIYITVTEINKPRIYDNKINLFYGFKFPDSKK